MLRRIVLLLLAPAFVTVTDCGSSRTGGATSLPPLAVQAPGPGIAPDPKATDVPAHDKLRGGIAIGADGLVYVSGKNGLDQFTQSLAPVSTGALSAAQIDTWPHIPTLAPTGGVTAFGSTINALATLPAASSAAALSPTTRDQAVLVQFDTSLHSWQPVSFIDTITGDIFVDFVKGPDAFGQPFIIGDRPLLSRMVGFLAFPDITCGTPPFFFILESSSQFAGPMVAFGAGAFDNHGVMWIASDPSRNSNKPSDEHANPSEIFAIETSGVVDHRVLLPNGSQVSGIVLGPDNAMWFTDSGLDAIGRVTQDGSFTEFKIPAGAGSHPGRITVGSDGALWFTQVHGNKIGRITTSGTVASQTNVPTANAHPFGIVGSIHAVFFTEDEKLGKVTF